MNVLFILADQFRVDCLGHMGHSLVHTPNLDQLAQGGTSFSHCFNQTAPCGPSRASIYSGRYMCSTRSLNNLTPLRDAEENFGFALRQHGYNPGLIGYNDYTIDPALLPPGDPRLTNLSYANVLPGFDRVYYHEYDSDEYFDWLRRKGYPEELLTHAAIHAPDVPPEGAGEHLPEHFPARYRKEESECWYVTDRALQYLAEQDEKGNENWVLSLNYIKPHPPNICCAPYCDMYDPAAVPAALRRDEDLEPSHPALQLLAGRALQNERHLREYRACYYGMISELDDNLGRLFEYLRQTDQWDDTLIIFSADHGEHLGDHYLTGKGHLYDGAMRIPYIVRDPSPQADSSRGQICDNLVEAIDTAPTILDALGLDPPDRFHGRSVLPLLHGDATYQPKKAIFYEYDYRSAGMSAATAAGRPPNPEQHLLWVVRDQRYKYVHFADETLPPLLFDLEADPGEFDNVATHPDYCEAVLHCCQQLLRWRMVHEDQRMENWARQYR